MIHIVSGEAAMHLLQLTRVDVQKSSKPLLMLLSVTYCLYVACVTKCNTESVGTAQH